MSPVAGLYGGMKRGVWVGAEERTDALARAIIDPDLSFSELDRESDLRRMETEILKVKCGYVCIELPDFHGERGI